MDYAGIAQITLPLVNTNYLGLLSWVEAVLDEACDCGECGPCMFGPALSEFVGRYVDAIIELAEFVSPEDRERICEPLPDLSGRLRDVLGGGV